MTEIRPTTKEDVYGNVFQYDYEVLDRGVAQGILLYNNGEYRFNPEYLKIVGYK